MGSFALVLISQLWLQHLQCSLLLGHCYLRVGSDVDPDLAFPLYTALVTALTELQKEEVGDNFVLSGVYGFRLHLQGLGICTIQNAKFRVILLCEGFMGQGIPYLTRNILKKVSKLFDQLDVIITDEDCKSAHLQEERDDSFWWHQVVSSGLGQLQIEDSIKEVYPLRFIRIKFIRGEDNGIYIRTLEDSKQSLGFGWEDVEELIAKKIQTIYNRPHENFLLYESLFHQLGEFNPDFSPNSLVLTFHKKGDFSENQLGVVVFLSIINHELKIQFCLPLAPSISLEGSRKVFFSLQRIVL